MFDLYDAYRVMRRQKMAFFLAMALYTIGLAVSPEEQITKGHYLFATLLMVMFFAYMVIFHQVRFCHHFKVEAITLEGQLYYKFTPSELIRQKGKAVGFVVPGSFLNVDLTQKQDVKVYAKLDIFGKVTPART